MSLWIKETSFPIPRHIVTPNTTHSFNDHKNNVNRRNRVDGELRTLKTHIRVEWYCRQSTHFSFGRRQKKSLFLRPSQGRTKRWVSLSPVHGFPKVFFGLRTLSYTTKLILSITSQTESERGETDREIQVSMNQLLGQRLHYHLYKYLSHSCKQKREDRRQSSTSTDISFYLYSSKVESSEVILSHYLPLVTDEIRESK